MSLWSSEHRASGQLYKLLCSRPHWRSPGDPGSRPRFLGAATDWLSAAIRFTLCVQESTWLWWTVLQRVFTVVVIYSQGRSFVCQEQTERLTWKSNPSLAGGLIAFRLFFQISESQSTYNSKPRELSFFFSPVEQCWRRL